jgi:integrase
VHHGWPGKVAIRRVDIERIHDYARKNCSERDFLLVRLPMQIGLRTGEIATLCIENIDFETRTFQVLDSKKKVLYPLPLDVLTLQLIRDLCGFRTHGYVFRQSRSWKYSRGDKPLTDATIWTVIHNIAREAGVPGFNPRMLRHYFAAHWIYDLHNSVPALQTILRHESLESTQVYVGRLSFWEDVQREYDGIRNGPIVESQVEETNPIQAQGAHAKVCSDCAAVQVCKFAAQMPACAMSCCHKAPSHMIRLQEPLRQKE